MRGCPSDGQCYPAFKDVRDFKLTGGVIVKTCGSRSFRAWAAGPLLGSAAADGSECLYRVLGEELGDDHIAQLGFFYQQAVRGARDDG